MSAHADVSIRVLGDGDAGVLEHVAADVFDHDVVPALAAEFLADRRHHIAVALEGDRVVGMATALDYVHPDKPTALFINEVGVAPTHHRRGIGRRLVERLLQLGRELGCKEAWVGTEHDNVAARGLYQALGGASEPFVMYAYTLNRQSDAGA